MDELKTSLLKLITQLNALGQRERVMLGVSVLGIVFVVGNIFVMQPSTVERKRLNTDITSAQQQLAVIEQQSLTIGTTGQGIDPNQESRERLALLTAENTALDQQLVAMTAGLIEPAQMAQVLQEALTRETELKLVRARNLGAAPLIPIAAGAAATASAGPALYRHGLVIEFDGGYLATLRYLKALEALPWRLFWDSVELRVQKFPQAHITITVHTLSLKEGWIGV